MQFSWIWLDGFLLFHFGLVCVCDAHAKFLKGASQQYAASSGARFVPTISTHTVRQTLRKNGGYGKLWYCQGQASTTIGGRSQTCLLYAILKMIDGKRMQ